MPTAKPPISRAPSAEAGFRLPGGSWRLWRDFVLRGTGFAASSIEALNSNAVSAAADVVSAAHIEVERTRTAAFSSIRNAVHHATRTDDREALKLLRKRRRCVSAGRVDPRVAHPDDLPFVGACASFAKANAAYEQTFAREAANAEHVLQGVASEPRFREATIWQNRRAAGFVSRALAGKGRQRRRRDALHLVAMQLQRYALKNDSIGFFGPVGWARLTDRPMTVDYDSGPSLIVRREVYFEGWCIDALADRLDALPDIRLWIAPRVRTGVWADHRHVYVPATGIVALTPSQRAVFDLCDGDKIPSELLSAAQFASPSDVDVDIVKVLDELVELGVISWRLEVASQLYPERALRQRIERIGDSGLRQECSAALTELTDARTRVASSAGNPVRLEQTLEELDATFSRVTGRAPVRRAGQMYAARSLVYEDCRRGGRLVLGTHFIERVGPALSIVLDSIQWTASALAHAVREHLRRKYAELRSAHEMDDIDSLSFYNEARRTVPQVIAGLREPLTSDLNHRWQQVLNDELSGPSVVRTAEDVCRRASAAFASNGRIWGHAQYIGPDVLVAAPSIEAFRRGDFQVVLGEVHTTSSLLRSCLVTQHSDRPTLAATLALDTGDTAVIHRQRPKQTWLARVVPGVHSPAHWQYQYLDEVPDRTDCRPAPAAMFVVADDGQTVRLRSRDGQIELDAIDLFGMLLSAETDEITRLAWWRSDHVPRVTIGDLTVVRERWQVRAGDFPFFGEGDAARQFVAVRAWAQRHRLSRRVFYKSPAERKPCYLDFNSPTYVSLFRKIIRRLGADQSVRIEEMFPDIDDVWLTDSRGHRYTCEFRFAACRDEDRVTSFETAVDEIGSATRE